MRNRRALRPIHRAARFFASIRPPAPSPDQTAWVHAQLQPGERRLFDSMAAADRSHSIGVARAVVRHGYSGWVVSAALTHDVGKAPARLGVPGRVAATLASALGAGRWSASWRRRGGYLGRIGAYLDYPELGSQMLAEVGADPRVSAWSAEHHLSEDRWTVPIEAGRALVAADDGRLGS